MTIAALSIAVAYLCICAAFFVMQGRLTYFPARPVRLTPRDVGIPFEEVALLAADGIRLHGWAVDAPSAAPWILFCHGNGGNIAGRLDTVAAFRRMGCGLLMFDYRGYGRSEGTPSEAGLYADAEAAWRYLAETRGIAAPRIVIYGESLGGGVATELALRHAPGGLILQSTFTSVPDVGAPLYPWLPVRLLCRHRFPSVERVGAIRCPKLVMHSPQDTVIPYALGRRLFEQAAEPKTWAELSGDHNTPLGDDWARAVQDFLRIHLGNHAAPPAVVDGE